MKPLISLVVIAVLSIAQALPVSGQDNRNGNKLQSTESAQAESLFQKALLLSGTAEVETVFLMLQEALNLWLQIREPEKAVKAALEMGDRYKQATRYQNALRFYNLALEIKPLPDSIKANIWNVIASLYVGLAENDLAVYYFIKALNQARINKDFPAQMTALTNLANIYYQQREKKQALIYIRQAQQLIRQKKAEPDPYFLYLLGQISQEEGLLNKAKESFEEALKMFNEAQNLDGQVKVLCTISSLYLMSSQKEASLNKAKEALELAENSAKQRPHSVDRYPRELRWRAWLSRARAERSLGQKEQACVSYLMAANNFETAWWKAYVATEASALASREDAQGTYRELVDLLIELGRFKEAYEWADMAKARTILNVTEARRLAPASTDNNNSEAMRELSQLINSLRLQLLDSNISTQQKANLQEQLEEAEYKLKKMQTDSEVKSLGNRLVWSQLATVDELQKRLAKDRLTLAEFFLGEERSFIWLFANGDIFLEILPSRKNIEKHIRLYLDNLALAPSPLYIENDIVRLRKQAEVLFSILFGRLSEHIEPGQRLVLVPDGLLHYLPFETLIHNGCYLVQDHEISYNPSASLLMLLQDLENRNDIEDKMELIAVGNPVFKSKPVVPTGRRRQYGLHREAAESLADRGFSLAPLPRTQDEVQYIADLFPSDRRKVFLGKEVTEETIKREATHHYRRWHFATHSVIDEKSPLKSAVVLISSDDGREDGLLEAGEISKLSLNCDLVVVSACQTGHGKLLSGEGIVGLSRAFLHAGAKSVVVSLWNVSDISTGQLMKNFYRNLTEGMSNVSALRKAKIDMFSSEKQTRHPYYWSSFIMMGNP